MPGADPVFAGLHGMGSTPGRTHFDVDPAKLEELEATAKRQLEELLAEWRALLAANPRLQELEQEIAELSMQLECVKAARAELTTSAGQ